ncbi:polysaccharide biosynthesis tyrosine autokinase [Massilia sp. Dwa41.01b]|uniref:polysaccharide biosynthesis tyrosine autokinase n=1 Tax=unclassified Massilia TaxID=2609279 RepID=UPI0015FFAC12|nr:MULTISPECIES: polysaccharide biosynthesis tyrosine autokinase [unclassified Massilia]QNA89675.1 polysaccharide biosynthesis tyrosine autokinase [Massilia sp. Dwa41.01b]QNB00570.1 polysaccharide biosynthesis tyrosine autokinase [Massilia sp. Se16.2.3]
MNQSASTTILKNPESTRDDAALDIASYIDAIIDNRGRIIVVAALVVALAIFYTFVATPIYQANMLIQVEDSAGSPANMFGDLAGAFDMKSAATAEIEILRSRTVVGRAVENAQLYLSLQPKRVPLLGDWIARGSETPSKPGFLGLDGYTWGGESATVTAFKVPESLEGEDFLITAMTVNRYKLESSKRGLAIIGVVGAPLSAKTEFGQIELTVASLVAQPGAQFVISRAPMLETVETLQRSLSIAERGKQSGIIGIALDGVDQKLIVRTLNEIGMEYTSQNIDRKSEEAQKSLTFLEAQLPRMKESLESAETKYNELRNSRGTVDLSEEAKSILQQSVANQVKLSELRQKREELLVHYQPANPIVRGVEEQIGSLSREIEAVNSKIRKMPAIEQDVVRLTRDIKVNTDLYTALLNSAQQLKLVKASKVGNARVLDEAVIPREPIRPRKSYIIAGAAIAGVMLGVMYALARKLLFGGIEDPHELEQHLGLTVSAAIPHSAQQSSTSLQIKASARKLPVLAEEDATELAIESLRSFRTSLQFLMLSAHNKVVMISGPTPGVGKSFVSVNLAAVLASTGKRVLLIDADIRRGYLQRYFGLERQNGLSDVLSNRIPLESAVHREVLGNLDFISTGILPLRPAELLEHANLASVFAAVEDSYDFIVVDTAPILAVTDALIIAPYAGTVINIVRSKVTSVGEIEETQKRVALVGAKVSSWIFNDLRHSERRFGTRMRHGKYRYANYKY